MNYVGRMPPRNPVANGFGGIRQWEGSQARAFEELCFQLRHPTPPEAELIKTGAPDAGLEWYWRLPDGGEVGWQVKLIDDVGRLLDAMRRSLKSAVEKRPALRAMTFCIPIDLADDPSGASGRQGRQRFEEAKKSWAGFAPGVEIGVMGGGEILGRLALEENRGREWFFFNERILGAQWCRSELAGTIEDAGDRYTPTQDVELPVDEILEAISLPEELCERLDARVGALLRAGREFVERIDGRWAERGRELKESLVELESQTIHERVPPRVETAPMLAAIDKSSEALTDLQGELRAVAWPEDPEERDRDAGAPVAREREVARSLNHGASRVAGALWKLESALEGPGCQAAERQALFVEGEAGQGKTHLFCDVAERLLAAGHLTLCLLGERFRDGSPWARLAELLGDPALGPQEIATILAASGEASGRRAVLLIDALNESGDPGIWATELADMRRRLTAGGWVALAVSCRTSYLDLVEPAGGPDQGFVHVRHLGYQGREFEAVERIFALHDLEPPRVPLLLAEFNNPLFLKLYCEGLKDEADPPRGAGQLSAVFERFVRRRGRRVEKKLGLDKRLGIPGKAISVLADAFAKAGEDRLPYEEAAGLINPLAPHATASPKTLMETMIDEGLLVVDRGWRAGGEGPVELVFFPYQRFSDHLVVDTILSSLGDADRDEAIRAFEPENDLGRLLAEAPAGLVEAMAIQLPERWGIEIIDVFEFGLEDRASYHRSRPVFEAFLASVVLRRRDAFDSRAGELVNIGLRRFPEATCDALVSVAADPEHPFNSLRTHAWLRAQSMAERDAYWTMETYHSFGNPEKALDRLIRWSARGPYEWCEDEVVELAAVMIVWTFASPNRFARDYATKALASLLIDRPEVQLGLVERFAGIDDPYVIQRLAASILGAVARAGNPGHDRASASALLEALIDGFVDAPGLIPDIETRDYIATLARWWRRDKSIPPRLLTRATPPYGSRPPKMPRKRDHLAKTYPEGEDFDDGYGSLRSSALSEHSDWSHYVVGAIPRSFPGRKLGDPPPKPGPARPEEPTFRIDRRAWKRFEGSLSPEQLELLGSEDAEEQRRCVAELDPGQRDLLYAAYIPRRRRVRPAPTPAYPLERTCRFIFQRAIELGWTPERFAHFDAEVNRRAAYRSAHKGERFGKKYQWIARNELLARLSDNFVLEEWGRELTYEGAWQLHARMIDPTLAPEPIDIGDEWEAIRRPTFPIERDPSWWIPPRPSFDEPPFGSEQEWAERRDDLPSPERLLRVSDPDGTCWVILDAHYSWREDPRETDGVEPSGRPYRDIAILSAGTFLHRSDLEKLQTWLSGNPDLVRSLPDWPSQEIYLALWAELPDESDRFEVSGRWRRPQSARELPVRSVPVGLGYLGESGGFDCSISDSINADMPSRYLVEEAGLRWKESDGSWVDAQGREWVRYRETDEGFERDRALMIVEDRLREFLVASDLALALGLFCERRAFDELGGGIPSALGWVDYAAHLTFDGENWNSAAMASVDRHGASAEQVDR